MTTPPPNAEQIEAAKNVYAIAIMARGSAEAYQSLYEFTVSRDAARDQSVAAEAVKPCRRAIEVCCGEVRSIKIVLEQKNGKVFGPCIPAHAIATSALERMRALLSLPPATAPTGKCVCPNPSLHKELAEGMEIDPTKCYRPKPTEKSERDRLRDAVIAEARRFVPNPKTIQWERREIALRDALAAYEAAHEAKHQEIKGESK